MFHSGDLQSGIALAVQEQKAVLCFIHDDSEKSIEWESALTSDPLRQRIQAEAIALKITAGSEEAAFLTPICPINSTPAIILIKNASLQANLQSADINTPQLNHHLEAIFPPLPDQSPPPAYQEATIQAQGPAEEATEETGTWPPPPPSSAAYLTFPPSEGQFRLPNNAYDAMKEHTLHLLSQSTTPQQIYQTQLQLLDRLPILRDEVRRLRTVTTNPSLSTYARDKLLRMPSAAIKAQLKTHPSNSSSPPVTTAHPPPPGGQHLASTEYVYTQPPSSSSSSPSPHNTHPSPQTSKPTTTAQNTTEAALWTRLQRERQSRDREARERIKSQIASDRAERRRLADVRSQNDRIVDAEAEAEANAARETAKALTEKGDVRLQVRTFDGSVLRGGVFKWDATVGGEVRGWVDAELEKSRDGKGKGQGGVGVGVPYNLKIILTPLPNRNIETAEEGMPLADLGIRGSCTMVMVPVKGYVESYTGSPSGGIVASTLSGGYNLVTGAAGSLFGGVKYVLGYGGDSQQGATPEADAAQQTSAQPATMRVRTLADQRVEQMDRRGPNSQLYNGNQLNFEPNRDQDDDRKDD